MGIVGFDPEHGNLGDRGLNSRSSPELYEPSRRVVNENHPSNSSPICPRHILYAQSRLDAAAKIKPNKTSPRPIMDNVDTTSLEEPQCLPK